MLENVIARLRRERPTNDARELAGQGRREAGEDPAGAAQMDIASQDAGWADLVSTDGQTRYGRGHLFIWPEPPASDSDNRLRAELQSFVADVEPPEGPMAIRPEYEPESYPVTVHSFTSAEPSGIVGLYWDGRELPAALRELGGEI